jgi:hypothetical protein
MGKIMGLVMVTWAGVILGAAGYKSMLEHRLISFTEFQVCVQGVRDKACSFYGRQGPVSVYVRPGSEKISFGGDR